MKNKPLKLNKEQRKKLNQGISFEIQGNDFFNKGKAFFGKLNLDDFIVTINSLIPKSETGIYKPDKDKLLADKFDVETKCLDLELETIEFITDYKANTVREYLQALEIEMCKDKPNMFKLLEHSQFCVKLDRAIREQFDN